MMQDESGNRALLLILAKGQAQDNRVRSSEHKLDGELKQSGRTSCADLASKDRCLKQSLGYSKGRRVGYVEALESKDNLPALGQFDCL